MEFREYKEFTNPEQKDYDLLGEHTIKEEPVKELTKFEKAFHELYFFLGCPELFELAPYGFTEKDLDHPTKSSFEALRQYALDYGFIKDNGKGRK